MKFKLTALSIFIGISLAVPTNAAVETPSKWFTEGSQAVEQANTLVANTGKAKNVILFVGDGMGISTVTAARILEGQLRGENGEENLLSFEKLPYVALSKTYNTNQQTPDSAGTMTAMVSGIKTKAGVIGVNQHVTRANCASMKGNTVLTLLEGAEELGLSTGVVTTARVTHATPAATYAHSPERNWEDDHDLPEEAKENGCQDIASQLIDFSYGNGLEVAMGGGRRSFLPRTEADPEDEGKTGERDDGRNLTQEWVTKNPNSTYIWNQAEFDALDTATTDHVLGLFERSHMEYEHDRPTDTAGEPSLSQMTEKSLEVLSRNEKGYFLMVESGRIDHGHHAGNAYRALTDAIEFSNAVKMAMEKTDPKDTLIIVTADHSHVFTIAGYPTRGNDILGKVRQNGKDGNPAEGFAVDMLNLPYTALGYANGPGYTGASDAQAEGSKSFSHYPDSYSGITQGRPDLTNINTADPSYLQEAAIPLSSETHAAEDVAIYARGPSAHLFHGVHEQNYIFHVIVDAVTK